MTHLSYLGDVLTENGLEDNSVTLDKMYNVRSLDPAINPKGFNLQVSS